ncbi:STAS domain-containing protein [Actinoplanes sp. KI2]|uniref:STAS domain-containing protein n=1 Tax=Actinoplanes sp. KI2 TaxID=2983315 RepID=UPI0021D57B98|nr:STAS domain-containing protein [Actinoplanes sp. KI2]MCU7727964.1 STAS domain-containing protein [Actinoplanes sp. KI2]
MAPLTYEQQQIGDRLLVRLSGELSLASAPAVRAALLKALVEQPGAVVVDLTEVRVRQPSAMAVFTAIGRQAAMWPGTPLLLCARDEQTTRALAMNRSLQVFATVEQALSVPARRRTALISDTLLPVAEAEARARELAADACDRWRLPHLVGPACLIAGELAANAAVHAGTLAAIRLSVGPRYLLISVQDGSTDKPRPGEAPDTGRGLLLVAATAHRWGCHLRDDGKVVWASLRIRDARP